ncbi:right-handed parallel beta-helix repeat-containing protein [Candidatus Lokiarchaeum ossiferum]
MKSLIQRQQTKKLMIIFVFYSLIFTQLYPFIDWNAFYGNFSVSETKLPIHIPQSGLDDPIQVFHDDWEGFSGSGGSDSPYLIENLVIDAGGSSHGIDIYDCSLYFEIRNCTIYNAKNGIWLNTLSPGIAKVYNNTIYTCRGISGQISGNGIGLYSTNGIEIYNNTIYDIEGYSEAFSGNGMLLYISHYNEVHHNTIYDIWSGAVASTAHSGNGIMLTSAQYNNISYNQISSCSSATTSDTYAGNGIDNYHGDFNLISHNTIDDIRGGLGRYSGNGITCNNYYGITEENIIEENTISNCYGGTNYYTSNGILVHGESEYLVDSTQVLNNYIINCTGGDDIADGNDAHCGCGINLDRTIHSMVSGNEIYNCKGNSGARYAGNGIMNFNSEYTTVTQNIIENCSGYGNWAGNGIASAYENYNTISFNNISNSFCKGTGAILSGNGIINYQTDNTHIDYNRVSNANAGTGTYSGNGIYLCYEFDYSFVIGNIVRDCVKLPQAGAGWSILGTKDFDINDVFYNDAGDGWIGVCYRDNVDNRNDNNNYVGNTADVIYVDYGDRWLIEDNTVNTICTYGSKDNCIVGNFKNDGNAPQFNWYSNNKAENYFLKITSPEECKNYKGCGGIRAEYKWQYFGYELDQLNMYLDGALDIIHRPDKEFYIPWKANGSHSLLFQASDTSTTSFEYESKPITYTLENMASTEVVNIVRNTQEGGIDDPLALSYWDTSLDGDGTQFSPYEIKNLNIEIPANSPIGTAGISISNTDAFFVLKDCVIVGGVGHYGITISNVQNARIVNCTIIGIPTTYVPNDISATSYPIERGIFLDEDCVNNSIEQSDIYRTLSSGIKVDGNTNWIQNNVIANAQNNGITISGNGNTLLNNEIVPFGGPDYSDYHFLKGETDHTLNGILIEGGGSENTIEDCIIAGYPVSGINISTSICEENVIVGNRIENCAVLIHDQGANTHFAKITTPLDGAYFTGNNPLNEGYYSGTEGFQDVADGDLPVDWSIVTNTPDAVALVMDEKTDLYGYTHKKVLHCDTGQGEEANISLVHDFSANQSQGTIEFWVMKQSTATATMNFTFMGTSGNLFSLFLENGEFWFSDNTTINNTHQEFHDLFWYRICVDFMDSGTYLGLGDHSYQFQIFNREGDVLLYASDPASFTTTGNFTGFDTHIATHNSSASSIYFDAFGYSWSPDYRLGNNAYEGMLISRSLQEGFKSWDWQGYSLNDAEIIDLPFFSDVVIPLPNSLGIQTLQLYANDTSDFQTISPVVHFSYYFDRKLNIIKHTENDEVVAEYTMFTGSGIIKMDPATALNLTLEYNTMKNDDLCNTNASLYYRVSHDFWKKAYSTGSLFGENTLNYLIGPDNYDLGDSVDYYFGFQQYDLSGRFVQQYYWTQTGVKYFNETAQMDAFHKKVSPVPYQLTLNYSAYFQAEKTQNFTTVEGHEVSMTGFAPIAINDFSVKFYNTTDDMTAFQALFDEHVSALTHKFKENSSIITESNSFPPITEENEWISPFILPIGGTYVEQESTILIPNMLYETNEASEDNKLMFTREALNLTYKGIKMDWFNGKRALREFETFTGESFTCIRFDYYTGIMVYFNYNDFTEGAGKRIFFGLKDNNQSYPINLKIEMREELNDTDQDFVNMTLDGILYDPPGDRSYTEMSAGTSITTGWSLETQSGTDFQKEHQHLFVGFGFESDEYKIDTEGDIYEFELTHTYTHTLSSSKDYTNSELIGPGRGDLYFGTGTYIFYYFYVNNYYFVVNQSDPVNFPYDDILVLTVGSRIEYTITPNTSFSVLGSHLEDLGMSELAYENIFEDNEISGAERNYVQELEYSPLLWTAGGVNEFGYSSARTETSSFHSYMEYSNDTFFTWSQCLTMGVGGSFGVGVEVDWSTGWNMFETSGKIATLNTWSREFLSYESVVGEEQILVHLEDDDGVPLGHHDQFKMRIFNDTRYSSIGFLIDSDASYSSSPHEPFTGDRRPPTLCDFCGLPPYLRDSVSLNVRAFDGELDGISENNIWKVNFYYDDDPTFGSDSIFIGVQGEMEKTALDDPEEFGLTWDCSLLEGDYFIFAEAYDYGTPIPNKLVSDPQLVHIDNTAPSECHLIAYEPYYDAIPLYATATDDETDIAYIEYWDGDPVTEGSILLGWSDVSSDSYRFIWSTDPNGDDNGIHQIYAKAFDLAGNSKVSSGLTLNVTDSQAVSDQSDQTDQTDLPDQDDESPIDWQNALLAGGMSTAGILIIGLIVVGGNKFLKK